MAKFNDVVFLLMYTSLFIYTVFTQFPSSLSKRCNYSRYFSLQMSEKREFIIREEAKKSGGSMKFCNITPY